MICTADNQIFYINIKSIGYIIKSLEVWLNRIKTFYLMANFNRLKVVLAEQQKTGKWLAEQIGKSNCTVSKWCSNTVQPDLKTLNDIANALNIDVKDLIVSSANNK